jgi:hypothetical protein
MPENAPQLSPDQLYSTGRLLADRNGDGYPDDVRALIVCEDALDAETWCAVIDLAARLGLESSGFTPPLVSREPLPGRLPVFVRAGDGGLRIDEEGWQGGPAVIAGGSEAVRRLALAGEGDDAVFPPAAASDATIDLAAPFSLDGFLSDGDGDQAADSSRVQIVLGTPPPLDLGAALAIFAARLGVESGGLLFPLATTGETRSGATSLSVSIETDEPARLSRNGDAGLHLSGDPDALADLVTELASADAGALQPGAAAAREWLRRSLAGWTPEGRAALLHAALAERDTWGDRPSVRLLTADLDEQRRFARVVSDEIGSDTLVLGPGASDIVFQHEWTAEWEVERALDTLRQRVLPRLVPSIPVDVTIIVSEPPGVRGDLARQARTMLEHAGQSVENVRVLDAYKAGLSWLTEVVLPELAGLDDLERVVLRFRPMRQDDQPDALDLPIRWLQELFPADEILARELGLAPDQIDLQEHKGPAVYAVVAYAGSGAVLLRREFSPLHRRIDYLPGFPEAGSVAVTTGGVVVSQGDVTIREAFATDPERFWAYYRAEVLPHVRRLILEETGGKPLAAHQPLFDQLHVDLTISESDEPYGMRQERHSAAEALHEDIYFNTLDYIEELGRQTSGERLAGPGAVVPFVRVKPGRQPQARLSLRRRSRAIALLETGDGSIPLGRVADELIERPAVAALAWEGGRLVVELESSASLREREAELRHLALATRDASGRALLRVPVSDSYVDITVPAGNGVDEEGAEPADPALAGEILSIGNLPGQLARLERHPEVMVEWAAERSFQGRTIAAVSVTAPSTAPVWSSRKLAAFKPAFLVVARHHANEVASTTAAIQLIERLATDPEWRPLLDRVNVALIPLENPDGAALHDRLRVDNPTWKHHPARYNAVGYEFGEDQGNPDSRYGEGRVRDLLWRAWLPDIVVDNHGVPSHEWSQLFAGFGSPPRFGVSYWLVQALVYGILPYFDSDRFPEHLAAAEALLTAVTRAVAADSDLYHWNQVYAER